jgi:hypothetical protein
MTFDNESERKRYEFAVAQLRHAYQQLTAHEERWSRRGMQQFADGLIAPQIRIFERLTRRGGDE